MRGDSPCSLVKIVVKAETHAVELAEFIVVGLHKLRWRRGEGGVGRGTRAGKGGGGGRPD